MKKLIFEFLLSTVTLSANPNPDIYQAKPARGIGLAETEESEFAPG